LCETGFAERRRLRDIPICVGRKSILGSVELWTEIAEEESLKTPVVPHKVGCLIEKKSTFGKKRTERVKIKGDEKASERGHRDEKL